MTGLADMFRRRKSGVVDGSDKGPSYWGSARMAEAYAKDMDIELCGRPVIIRVPLANFDPAGLRPDDEVEYELECHVLGRSKAELSHIRCDAATKINRRASLRHAEIQNFRTPALPATRSPWGTDRNQSGNDGLQPETDDEGAGR